MNELDVMLNAELPVIDDQTQQQAIRDRRVDNLEFTQNEDGTTTENTRERDQELLTLRESLKRRIFLSASTN